VEECDLPWRPNWVEVARLLVGYALRAPSNRNTEPWHFRVRADAIDVMVDPARWLKVSDPDQRELYLSVGCALENLLIAAEHLGYGHEVEWFPDAAQEQWVARVRLSEGGEPSPFRGVELFDAMVERRTSHRTFLHEPVPQEALERMAGSVVEPGLRVHAIDDAGLRRWVGELVAQAELEEFQDPEYRSELAEWIGRGVLVTPAPLARIARTAVRHMDLGRRIASKELALLESAPLLVLLTAERDDRAMQVRAGMAVERMWLEATSLGLSAQPFSAPLQVARVKQELAGLAGTPERTPMHLFRVGYAEPSRRRRPRRAVDEVLERG
jgi:nitroreductase